MTITERVMALLQMRHALSGGITYYGIKESDLRASYDEAKEALFEDLESLEPVKATTGAKSDPRPPSGCQLEAQDPSEVLTPDPAAERLYAEAQHFLRQ